MLFVLKAVISGLIIAYCSWLALRKPVLAGFITAVPLTSILAITWTYAQQPDMAHIQRYVVAIVVAIPLSLTFFIPFLLHRWLHWSFVPTLIAGLLLLGVAYKVHSLLLQGS